MNRWLSWKDLLGLLIAATSFSVTVQAQQYSLLNGGFDSLNTVLKDTVVRLPPNSQTNTDNERLSLSDIVCRKMQLQDIQVTHSVSLGWIAVQISGVSLECQARFRYDGWSIFNARGDATVISQDSQVQVRGIIQFQNDEVPTDVSLQSCQPTVQIQRLDLKNDGGGLIQDWIFQAMQRMARGVLEDSLETMLCEEIRDIFQSAGETRFPAINEPLTSYPVRDDYTSPDPLALERGLSSSTAASSSLLDFQNPNTPFSQVLHDALIQGVAYLQEPAPNTTLMNANILVRENLLNEDRALSILGDADSPWTLFYHHDPFLETTMELQSVQILGLDSMKSTSSHVLDIFSRHTLSSDTEWEYLALHVKAILIIRPSSLEESLVTGPSTLLEESVTVVFGVQHLQASMALLLAVQQDVLERLPVGALMHSQHAVPCFLSTLLQPPTFTNLIWKVTNGGRDVFYPYVTGMESPGLDRLINQILTLLLELYDEVVIDRLPAFTDTTMKQMMNDQIRQYVEESIQAMSKCPAAKTITQGLDDTTEDELISPVTSQDVPDYFVDFRDLLLNPFDAWWIGATGNEPYGDVLWKHFMPFLDSRNATWLNHLLASWTQSQSGQVGRLEFSDSMTLIEYISQEPTTLYDGVVFYVSDLRLDNVNTFQDPLNLLDILDWNELIVPSIKLSDSHRPLTLTTNVLLAIGGENSPLSMTNQLDVSISFPSTLSMSLEMLVHMKDTHLLNFPLADITNPNCWLATLTPFVQTNIDGTGGGTMTLEPFVLEAISIALESFALDSKCITCTSPAAHVLSEVLREDLSGSGFYAIFARRFVGVMQDFVWYYVREMDSFEMLEMARRKCPHHSSDGADIDVDILKPSTADAEAKKPVSEFSLQNLSQDSVETMLGLGVVGFPVGVALVAKNHLLRYQEEGDEMFKISKNDDSLVNHNETMLDWKNLSKSFGDWADYAFEELRDFATGIVGAHDADGNNITQSRLVTLLMEYALNDRNALVLDYTKNPALFNAAGVEVYITKVELMGLDTASISQFMMPMSFKMLRNQFQIENLTARIEVTLKRGSKIEAASISYSFRDLHVGLHLQVGVDLASVYAVRFGSIYDTQNILACVASNFRCVQIDNLSVTLGEMDGPRLSGLLASDFKGSVDSILGSLSEMHHDDIILAVPIILNSTFKEIVNDMIPDTIEWLKNECPSPQFFPSDRSLDFRDLLLEPLQAAELGGSGVGPYGDLFATLYSLLYENVLQTGASNRPVINDLFRKITESQSNSSGTFTIKDSALDSRAQLQIAGLQAEMGFRVFNVTLENIDSVGDPLKLLKPLSGEAHTTGNQVSFGVDSKPLSLATSVVLSLSDGANMNIRNEIRLALSVEDLVLSSDIFAKVSERGFANFPIGDLSNFHCWLATISSESSKQGEESRGIGFENHSFLIGDFTFSIVCENCTSPQFDELLLSLYKFENATELETAVRERLGTLFDADYFPVFVDELIVDSSKRCPHHPNYNPDYSQSLLLNSPLQAVGGFLLNSAANGDGSPFFNFFNTLFAVLLFLFGVVSYYWVKQRNQCWVRSLSREGSVLLQAKHDKDEQMQLWLDSTTQSLFLSDAIPRNVRLGVPIAILGNIGLYLGGHFGTLSIVNVDVALAGEKFQIEKFLEFKFIQSTVNTFNNGGAEMAVLMWIFTGIWPYVKLLVSLAVWVVPPSILRVGHRRRLLIWIDTLAKLSVIDIFTMLLGFAIFLVFIGGPDEALQYAEGTLYAFKAIVVPRAGFYCLIVAQRISRVSSRYLLDYHDLVVDSAAAAQKCRTRSFSQVSVNSSRASSFSEPSHNDCNVRSDLDLSFPVNSLSSAQQLQQDYPSQMSSHVRPDESFREETGDDGRETESTDSTVSEFRWGSLGVRLGVVTILIIFVIGCILAPAISLDTSSIASLAAESGLTYAEVVREYGVFLVISGVLVKARFVLDRKADYVGLGFLLLAGLISVGCIFFIQAYHFIKRKWKQRKQGNDAAYGHKGCGLPSYLRLHKWKHMEIYIISVAIGVWQLGSACSYAIHMYCDILGQIYTVMAYIGLTDESTAQCVRIQTGLPGNLIIIGGSFAMLLASFFFQAASQCKQNISEALRFVDDEDVPRMSLLWSKDKRKNIRYSHLSASLSVDSTMPCSTTQVMPSTPTTTATTPPSTPRGSFSHRRSTTFYYHDEIPEACSSETHSDHLVPSTQDDQDDYLTTNSFRRVCGQFPTTLNRT